MPSQYYVQLFVARGPEEDGVRVVTEDTVGEEPVAAFDFEVVDVALGLDLLDLRRTHPDEVCVLPCSALPGRGPHQAAFCAGVQEAHALQDLLGVCHFEPEGGRLRGAVLLHLHAVIRGGRHPQPPQKLTQAVGDAGPGLEAEMVLPPLPMTRVLQRPKYPLRKEATFSSDSLNMK